MSSYIQNDDRTRDLRGQKDTKQDDASNSSCYTVAPEDETF